MLSLQATENGRAVSDVARVAVDVEDGHDWSLVRTEPAVQSRSIVRGESDVLVLKIGRLPIALGIFGRLKKQSLVKHRSRIAKSPVRQNAGSTNLDIRNAEQHRADDDCFVTEVLQNQVIAS